DTGLNGGVVSILCAKTPRARIPEYTALRVVGHQQSVSAAVRVIVEPGSALLGNERLDIESDVRIDYVVVWISVRLGRSSTDAGRIVTFCIQVISPVLLLFLSRVFCEMWGSSR